MKPEEQRIAIAEACGWKRHPRDPWIVTAPNMPDSVQPLSTIPDYLNDLNAMHEAWKMLDNYNQSVFTGELIEIIQREPGVGTLGAINAIAAQRGEAFLKTLGLWKEES